MNGCLTRTSNRVIRIQEADGNYFYICETTAQEILAFRHSGRKYILQIRIKDTNEQRGEVREFKSERALRDYLANLIYMDAEG